ncbi:MULTISPECIES: DUF748 domain-containing protein [unclassified Caballeronia]|uniref:DUF748 domain-containing protein n=1 Tax=unclassified Caballeronia TaxID=2646786 RepID=UPI001FD36182|nr:MULTISPECIES: DUF748 domain-containing protein [unclassified Caballeronia]MDR5772626.1 DUF748 domain-containing protein [Caballeronia sp. LZ002]MDR5803944.1 DUF748 domain-containing protein [Caballeronia sp. LZ001]MDR5848060.1 DUF748 domain-containing protein [Caballeronia sp. LZ003]
MARSKAQRGALWAVGIVVAIIVVAVGGWLFVAHQMKERILETLGPNGSAEEIDVGFGHVTLSRVRLRGPQDWPASDAMRAERIVLDIDMHEALRNRVHLHGVSVDNYYLSIVRSADGRVQILPGLKETARVADAKPDAKEDARSQEEKLIDRVSFERGSMEFFDSSVQKPPYRVLISDSRATIDHLHLPALTDRTNLSMSGSIKGPSHTGTVSWGGWMVIANKDSQTRAVLSGVDIASLDPYLLKKAGARAAVTGGTIDLTVDANIHDYRIHAPGTLTLNHLQISDTGNGLDTFLSIPTKAAVAALKDRKDQIKLDFVLDGDLRDPKFSLQESLSKKLAAGFAKALGVSVEGVAKGTGDTVRGIGNALKSLLGQ